MSTKHDGDLTSEEIALSQIWTSTDLVSYLKPLSVDVKEGEDRVAGPADTAELVTFRRELRRISRPYQGKIACG